MVLRILLLIYVWALMSLVCASWGFIRSWLIPCPRYTRWLALLGAVMGAVLLSAAVVFGEALSWGYLVPVIAAVLGAWGARRGRRFRRPRGWQP